MRTTLLLIALMLATGAAVIAVSIRDKNAGHITMGVCYYDSPLIAKNEYNPTVDIPKLCRAIGGHESGHGTSNLAKNNNNYHGIRRKGAYMAYATKEESYRDCEAIWRSKSYGRFPDMKLAKRWSSQSASGAWLKSVTSIYNLPHI